MMLMNNYLIQSDEHNKEEEHAPNIHAPKPADKIAPPVVHIDSHEIIMAMDVCI